MSLKKNLKVYVGIPWLRNDGYTSHLGSCLNYLKKQECGIDVMEPILTQPYGGKFKKGEQSLLYAIMNRMNAVVDGFIRTNASHLFVVDADVEIPSHGLDTLLRHDVDLASGVYPFHNFKKCRAMMFGRMPSNDPCGFFVPRDWDYMKDQVFGEDFPVSGGTGCLLVKRRVFKRYHPKVKALRFNKKQGECGADVYFWKRAQDMGFTARVDARVVCGHLPEYPLHKYDKWLETEDEL